MNRQLHSERQVFFENNRTLIECYPVTAARDAIKAGLYKRVQVALLSWGMFRSWERRRAHAK